MLGRLSDCLSLEGYIVRPFVGLCSEPPPVRVDGVEVSETVCLDVFRLTKPENRWRVALREGDEEASAHYFRAGEHVL